MIEEMDMNVGALIDALEAKGELDNTYILFTADNGGGHSGRREVGEKRRFNGPLQEGKRSIYEGGIRVPTVISGPGIKEGSQCDVPIVQWDFLSTFHDLSGSKAPLPEGVNGGSLRDVFPRGNKGRVARGLSRKNWPTSRKGQPSDFESQKAAMLVELNKKLVKNEINKEKCSRQATNGSWWESVPKGDIEKFVLSRWVDYTVELFYYRGHRDRHLSCEGKNSRLLRGRTGRVLAEITGNTVDNRARLAKSVSLMKAGHT